MNKIRQIFSLILFVLVMQANAKVITGRVVSIADGDTITVLDSEKTQHKIRLMGIDAPEKSQAYGQASRKNLSNMVLGKNVSIEWVKYDRYHRIVGKVLIKEMDVCLEQVKNGFAWHYKQYQNEQTIEDRLLYATAELNARKGEIGLWKDVEPVEPSHFRRKKEAK